MEKKQPWRTDSAVEQTCLWLVTAAADDVTSISVFSSLLGLACTFDFWLSWAVAPHNRKPAMLCHVFVVALMLFRVQRSRCAAKTMTTWFMPASGRMAIWICAIFTCNPDWNSVIWCWSVCRLMGWSTIFVHDIFTSRWLWWSPHFQWLTSSLTQHTVGYKCVSSCFSHRLQYSLAPKQDSVTWWRFLLLYVPSLLPFYQNQP